MFLAIKKPISFIHMFMCKTYSLLIIIIISEDLGPVYWPHGMHLFLHTRVSGDTQHTHTHTHMQF